MGAHQGYGQYCGMARGAEILATPWTPIIVRNLLLGCHTFTEILDGAPGLSRTLLAQRLRMLCGHGIVERLGRDGYRLTPSGLALDPVLQALGSWGETWLDLAPEHLDAGVVLWGLARVVPADLRPPNQVVLRIEVCDDRRGRFWLLADAHHMEVCVRRPGTTEHMVVITDSRSLTRWHTGRVSLAAAMRAGLIRVDGTRPMIRMLASWGGHGAYPTTTS
ncbi:MAG TPA: helix-turn-helix domain-containing protein [Rugosimonospora sp.]|nr:helix-turn-helix domain-containing protein [Rugosimonospora sp.]